MQICDNAQNDAFVAKIANTRLTKICVAIFALAERLPTFATLETTYFLTAAYHLDQGSTRARTTWSCLLSRGSSSILRENNVWSSVVITNQSPLFIQENENER